MLRNMRLSILTMYATKEAVSKTGRVVVKITDDPVFISLVSESEQREIILKSTSFEFQPDSIKKLESRADVRVTPTTYDDFIEELLTMENPDGRNFLLAEFSKGGIVTGYEVIGWRGDVQRRTLAGFARDVMIKFSFEGIVNSSAKVRIHPSSISLSGDATAFLDSQFVNIHPTSYVLDADHRHYHKVTLFANFYKLLDELGGGLGSRWMRSTLSCDIEAPVVTTFDGRTFDRAESSENQTVIVANSILRGAFCRMSCNGIDSMMVFRNGNDPRHRVLLDEKVSFYPIHSYCGSSTELTLQNAIGFAQEYPRFDISMW